MLNPGQFIPISDGANDDLAPEHTLFLAVLYTYFEDIRKYARISCKETRADKWHALRELAYHEHTKNICQIVGVNHRWFLARFEKLIKEVEEKWEAKCSSQPG